MKRLPIDLSLKTVSTKVSLKAWERVQELKEANGCRLSDIVSICLLYMPEDEVKRILAEQEQAVGELPKAVRGMLRNVDRLSEDEKKMIVDLLS